MFNKMNYKHIYDCIVCRAQLESAERLTQKKIGAYFERHHIKPKSIGGDNSKDNLVLLTPREHFICHALLVRFLTGTELTKMNWAFFRLCSCSKKNNPRKCGYVNARIYEKFKQSFQAGSNNSQYGTHWWVNKETGKTIKATCSPGDMWKLGRSLNKNEHPYSGKALGVWNIINNDEISKRVDAILNCGVDLTRIGWIGKVAGCLGCSTNKIKYVYDRSEVLQSHCFRRSYMLSKNGNQSIWDERLQIVLNSGIDYHSPNWKNRIIECTGLSKYVVKVLCRKYSNILK